MKCLAAMCTKWSQAGKRGVKDRLVTLFIMGHILTTLLYFALGTFL